MKRIAVGVELWSAEARPMVVAAARLAAKFDTRWMVIAVSDAAHSLPRLTAEDQQRARQNAELVTSLGGTPFFCDGEDVAYTLLSAALVHGADLLVLGKPHRGIIGRLFARSVADSLLTAAPNIPLMFIGAGSETVDWSHAARS